MSARRVAFATAAVTFAVAAFACARVFHIAAYVPIGTYLAVLCGFALLERGRYRPNVGSAGSNWQPTGERFFDPTTGARTEVFFDPKTGARDYRAG